jgi:hypothetical protein
MLDFLRKLFNSIFGSSSSSASQPSNQPPEITEEPVETQPEVEEKAEIPEPIIQDSDPEEETEESKTPKTSTNEVTPPDTSNSVETPEVDHTEPSASMINPEIEADLDLPADPEKLVISVQRFDAGTEDTLGKLYLNGKFTCYTLEPPASGQRIPAGQYGITLDTNSGRHATYRFRFKDIHKGMLELESVTGFSTVQIRIGNRADDTHGSILVGEQIAQYDHENPGRFGLVTRLI